MRSVSYCCAIAAIIMTAAYCCAGDDTIDESALFSDTNTVISGASLLNNAAMSKDSADKKTVGISGEINTALTGAMNRDWFDDLARANTQMGNYTVGNIMLDVRLPKGVKGFANLEAQYNPAAPAGNQMIVNLREIFFDANINNRAYFRIGKQVLQWGRCYFWNPTDLINVEKKLFIQSIQYREGAYGMRTHVPFGTVANLYGFLDTRTATSVDSVAGVIKAEVLIKGTEMSLSAWGKRGFHPVFGYDISTRVRGVDIAAEISASYGDNATYIDTTEVFGTMRSTSALGTDTSIMAGGSSLTTRKGEEKVFVPRVCLSAQKSFDVMNVIDRVMVIGEFYYNHAGSDENVFSESTLYFDVVRDGYGYAIIDPVSKLPVLDMTTTKSSFLYSKNLYEANSYSKYYAALFVSVNKFLMSDMVLQANALANIKQRCATAYVGLSYSTLYNLKLGLTIIGYLGPKNAEYTFNPRDPSKPKGVAVLATAGISF